MSIENIQSQIQALRTRITNLNVPAGAAAANNHRMLVASLEEMSMIAEGLLGANAEVERRLAIQYAVMRALAESIGTNEAYDSVLQAICEVTGGELGTLWIFDRDTDSLHIESVWQTKKKPLNKLAGASRELTLSPGQGLAGTVYLSNKPVWVPNVIDHPDFHPLRKQAVLKSGPCSVFLFPIRKEDEVLGVIECFNRQVEQPAVDLVEMLDALGSQIGAFMERKYAEDLLAARVHQQAVVAAIGQRALVGVELQELLDEVSALIATTLSVDFSKILQVIPEENRLLLRAGVGWEKGLVGQVYVDNGPHSQGGYSLSTNTPIIVADLGKETRFQPSAILVEHGIVSGLSVIIPGRPQPFGILSAHSTKRRTFTEDDIHFLQAVAHVLAAAIQRQEVEEELRLSRNEIAIILDGIADGITAQNEAGKLIYANDAAARIVGYASAAEFLNTPIERAVMPRFQMFDEQGAPLAMDRLPGRRALRGESPAPLTIRFKIVETGEERWSVVKAQAVKDEGGQVVMAVNIFQDITDLKRTELTQRLLAEASDLLDTSLDYETRLANLAKLVVPRLADWCTVDILDEHQILQRVAVVHIDPAKVAWAHELQKRYPPDPNAPTGVYNVIRTSRPQYVPVFTQEMLDAVQDPERKKLVIELGLTSFVQVPLIARGHALGVLTLVWAESGHHYSPADVALAQDLARRAAMALDNARLYTEAQRLNAELEQRVEQRTFQLEKSNLRLKDEVKERKRAEKEIRDLNAELEERVVERTRQLEDTNQDLQHEIVEREQADQALQLSLERTRELYEVSQEISLVRTPDAVLQALISSTYLQPALRASVVIFDTVWREGDDTPERCTILTAWAKDPNAELNIGREYDVQDFGLIEFYSRYEPLIITDVYNDPRVSEITRQRMRDVGVASSVIFPLIAGGERYGMLSLHFEKIGMLKAEDVIYLRGLVDQAAVSIHNFRLLQAEASARREAEEANNLKLKFLAMISHELRTPLTSIKGFATTLLAKDVQWEAENQKDFIETIDLEADKLTDLIEQLLDLSRLEAGTMRIVAQRVIWEDVLSTAMAQLQALTVNHQLIVEEESDLPPLKVDVVRVPQVITNLVSNAVKYSPPHTTITISTARISDQFIQVRVLDEGPGIPPEARNRVFEAFQQLEREKDTTRGAGLGLAICRGLIEAHGGKIWVDEEHSGPGTTISFTLPIYQLPSG
jgi:PAS domain S-box-containing protein